MPNWCFSSCAFYTNDENKGELLRLYKNLEKIMEQPSEVPNGFEPGWLGKVAIAHNLDWEKISCRGEISELEEYSPNDKFFTLRTETAWAPTEELWEAVIAQYEGVSYVFIAEESGMGIYVNTDTEGTYFPDRYMMDIWGDGPIPEGWYADQEKPSCLEIREYFENFASLADFCKSITGKEFDTFENLQNYFSDIFDEDDNVCVGIHEFEAA
jgi:hypothetical protein